MSSPDTKSNESGRIRSSRACLHCSRRKVKCDGLQPCNNCTKDSVACEYGAQKKRGPPKGCDPRGGRKKKVQDPPSEANPPSSTIPAKRKAPLTSKKDSTSTNTKDVPIAAAPTGSGAKLTRKPSTSKKAAAPSSSSSQPSGSDHNFARSGSAKRDSQASEKGIPSISQPAIASLTPRPSSDARNSPNDRTAAPWHASSSSQPAYDSHQPWSRPLAPQPSSSSPSLSRHSSYLADMTTTGAASSNHHFSTTDHASQHASADYKQPYAHFQPTLHHHDSYQSSSHSWSAGPSSSVEPPLPLQQSTSSTHNYDVYLLQAPLRDYHRSSPLASHRSMLPPHSSSAASSSTLPSHTPQVPASQPSVDRASAAWSSGRSNVPASASASTFASPRSNATRSLYESPVGHYQSGTSPFDRASAMPTSSSSLSSRHPVSASRLTEPSGTTTQATPANAPSSSSHNTGVSTSPAFTGHSHGYSPSSTAMPHRPWYNGSQPSSPRGPNSIPRSQISSPGAHWLDYHVRPPSVAANHPHLSSRIHLENRLPPHILQRLLDIYQVFVHPHWPVIYLPSVTSLHSLKRSRPIVFEAILAVASNTFDAYLDAAADDDHQSSNPVLELLYAESPQGSEPSWKSNELRDHFVHRVKTRIFEGKFTQDIGTIQAAILISVIELGCGNTSSAFQFGGIACRMALDMNLHRCTAQFSASTSATADGGHSHGSASASKNVDGSDNGKAGQYRSGAQMQERLRTFWACFILDKILSTALDKPAQLRSAEIEADWPSVQEADEYDLWLNETTRKFVEKNQLPRLEGVKVHALSSFKAWAEVMAILERILEEVYSPQAKRDRRRTKGASDYEALLRLNDRLSKWRADLPSHLKWTGTWTSPEMLSSNFFKHGSADRKESEPHRGLPPQILTMRSWYCICLILLHRPRVPKLLEGPKDRSATAAEDSLQSTAQDAEEQSPSTKKGKKAMAQPTKKAGQTSAKDRRPELAGLEICNAAAKEVCDILHVYGSSFRIRKISSSWVYLIFQSATIHAAIAASKSVVAFKARQSSIWSRRGSKVHLTEATPSASDALHNDMGVPIGSEDDPDMHVDGGDEAHHVTEAELEGSSELVKTSARYLAECVRYLKRIGPTWQSASNHVAVLRNLCIASVQARPHSPTLPDRNGNEQRAAGFNGNNDIIKREDQHGSAPGTIHGHGGSASGFGFPHDDPQFHNGLPGKSGHQDGPDVPTQRASVETQAQMQTGVQHNGHMYQSHGSKAQAVPVGDAATLGIGTSDNLQAHFLEPTGYPHDQMLPSTGVPVQQHQHHSHQHHHHQQQQMQQALHPINANDSAFWASMPVASEGYNEWDEFFKAFNPSSAGTDVASQNANYHPTAAVDLITALQDPNRLLNGMGPQQGSHQ